MAVNLARGAVLAALAAAVWADLASIGPAALGITAPFWLASGAVGLLTVAAWRRLRPDALASSPTVDRRPQ